jgi:hypothetical protein
VLANNYSAEYGGSAGGVIIETTRSGTNQFHASTYEYLRNDAMDAPGFFAPIVNGAKQTPPLRYNVFGVTAGGPIRRNQTFFFAAYEGTRRHTGSVTTLTVPTDLQRAGDFSSTLNAQGTVSVYDPAGSLRQPFPATCSQDVSTRRTARHADFRRSPGAGQPRWASNFQANSLTAVTSDFLLAKVDQVSMREIG